MRIVCGAKAGLVLVLSLYAAGLASDSKSDNREAMRWFAIGQSEKDPDVKIQAFRRAVELDPGFVDAHYHLALVYQTQRNFTQAEQSLLNAYNARPNRISNELKQQILFQLGETYASLKKFKEAEEAFRGAKGLGTRNSLLPDIFLELGRVLLLQHEYERALVELEEGQKLNGANREQYAALVQSIEDAIELQERYLAAEQVQVEGKLGEAAALFQKISSQHPGYLDVEKRLRDLNALLQQETSNDPQAALYARALQYETERNYEKAVFTYQSLVQKFGAYRDSQARLEQARRQLESDQLAGRLEGEYAAGIAALHTHDWVKAILAFEKILGVEPLYRDAGKRLEEAQKGLEKESQESVIARYYTEGMAELEAGDLEAAHAALKRVHKLDQDYRDVASLVAEIEERISQRAVTGIDASEASRSPDSLRQAAQAAMDKKEWSNAVEILEKLYATNPHDHDLHEQLAWARANLRISSEEEDRVVIQHSIWMVASVVAAVIMLPMLGIIAFSPSTRARLHMLRGNYDAAAKIFELLLAHDPGRIKLYPPLANIYLISGRNDEPAMKVYKTILQLDLATNNREQISAIVAQNCLSHGHADPEAIEMLEKALQVEFDRQGTQAFQPKGQAKQ